MRGSSGFSAAAAEHGATKFARLNLKLSPCLEARCSVGIESVGRMRRVLNWVGWVVLGAALIVLAIASLN
jgi:hypothetical protein